MLNLGHLQHKVAIRNDINSFRKYFLETLIKQLHFGATTIKKKPKEKLRFQIYTLSNTPSVTIRFKTLDEIVYLYIFGNLTIDPIFATQSGQALMLVALAEAAALCQKIMTGFIPQTVNNYDPNIHVKYACNSQSKLVSFKAFLSSNIHFQCYAF